ncbi:MAG: dihydrolipoyl dehydrogenase [Dethiobacter sp.]|jgi:dihydrolipoamide dehydrogenase|nr:dihydrolipoyl dehydrogenase [Dethiobacter sp.]
MEHYQLTVIGGGPGGYAAALRAAALGQKTLLIEKETLGGTCLNHGCIPTKTLFHSAQLYNKIKKAGEFGFSTGEVTFSYGKIQDRKIAVVDKLVTGLSGLLKRAGVETCFGTAQLISANLVEIEKADGNRLRAGTDKIILAPGSEEIIPSVTGIELPGILTSREALALREVPSSLAVIGGGVIAVEMASIFASFGCSVTIVQRSIILRREDREMVRRLIPYLRKQGIKIMTDTQLEKIEQSANGYALTVSARQKEETVKAEAVLVAVGRKASSGGLDLNSLGIKCSSRGIDVSDTMETSAAGVYAIGDAAAPGYFLAHVATHQGIVAAENAAGLQSVFKGEVVPVCIFTQPELARVGLTEEEAREKGYDVKVGKFPFSANGKAFLQGEGEGAVKIVCDGKDGPVLGVHILGPHASDLIQEGALAVSAGIKISELADLIHPHPTLSEAVWEAALTVGKSPLHLEHWG